MVVEVSKGKLNPLVRGSQGVCTRVVNKIGPCRVPWHGGFSLALNRNSSLNCNLGRWKEKVGSVMTKEGPMDHKVRWCAMTGGGQWAQSSNIWV